MQVRGRAISLEAVQAWSERSRREGSGWNSTCHWRPATVITLALSPLGGQLDGPPGEGGPRGAVAVRLAAAPDAPRRPVTVRDT